MPDQSEAPIVRKLLRKTNSRHIEGLIEVNPDGPEAAEIIRLCEEALRQIESFAPIEGPTPPYVQIATFAKQTARLTLAQIKGQNP